jgi:hypothetical protein
LGRFVSPPLSNPDESDQRRRNNLWSMEEAKVALG